MKKNIGLFVIGLLFGNCTSEIEFPEISKNNTIDGLKLPNGSIVKKIKNSTIKITLPKNYSLVEINHDRIAYYSELSYVCTCSKSNGCDVFYVKGNYGCSHGSCTGECTGKFVDDDGKIFNKDHLTIINSSINISPATNEEFDKLEYMPSNLILSLESELKAYAQTIYGDYYLEALNYVDNKLAKKSDINDIMLVKMKMYGFKIIYSIDTNQLKKEVLDSNNFNPLIHESSSHSCKCISGTKGCTADSSWGVKYCKGGTCKECKMTVKK